MRKIVIALDKEILEDLVKLAKEKGKVKVYIVFGEKPFSKYLNNASVGQFYFYPPNAPYYEVEVTSTMTIDDIINKLKEEIYDLIDEYPEVILYRELTVCIDKERKKPVALLYTNKAICYNIILVDSEPVFAHVYDAETRMSYDITSKEALRRIKTIVEKALEK